MFYLIEDTSYYEYKMYYTCLKVCSMKESIEKMVSILR